MTIRLTRSVVDDLGRINITAWQNAVRAGISVGRCDCGAPANGEPITIGRRLTWATAICTSCHNNAARPVVPAVPVAA